MAAAFPIPLLAPVIMKERPTMDTSRSFAAKLLEAFSNPDLLKTSNNNVYLRVHVLTQFWIVCWPLCIWDTAPKTRAMIGGQRSFCAGWQGTWVSSGGLNRALCIGLMSHLKLGAQMNAYHRTWLGELQKQRLFKRPPKLTTFRLQGNISSLWVLIKD